jgi:predicted dehydrogenase
MPAPLRLGLVGAGNWGRNYIQTIAALPEVRLAGTAGRDGWRDLIDVGLDGLIVATPAATHAQIAAAALERGLHVLIEKPLCLDPGEARRLAALARDRRRMVMVQHTLLFHPGFRALKAALPGLGSLHALRSRAGRTGPFRPDAPVLWDWGSHDVAVCLDLLQARPTTASANLLESAPRDAGRGESVEIELRFGEVAANLFISNILPTRTRRFEAHCERGMVAYDEADPPGTLLVAGERVAYPPEPPLTVAVREFAQAIAGGAFDTQSIDLGVGVVEVLADCAASLS